MARVTKVQDVSKVQDFISVDGFDQELTARLAVQPEKELYSITVKINRGACGEGTESAIIGIYQTARVEGERILSEYRASRPHEPTLFDGTDDE